MALYVTTPLHPATVESTSPLQFPPLLLATHVAPDVLTLELLHPLAVYELENV